MFVFKEKPVEELAVIQAEFVQLKQLKSKPTMQLVFELPIEYAEQVTAALGWPKPTESIWCAIARLKKEETTL